MAFTLDQVVPWGRVLDEYCSMFSLDEDDRGKRILGCADGPASFNAEATRLGYSVVSCDPLYGFDRSSIQARIDEAFDEVMAETESNADEFLWTLFSSPRQLGDQRQRAMTAFLEDYDLGLEQGRYVDAALPELPFEDASFDLALCSHFLFLYSQHLDLDFHLESMRELLRVAREVRVFPLLQLGSSPSPYVEPTLEILRGEGFSVRTKEVPYEFQRGGNRALLATH